MWIGKRTRQYIEIEQVMADASHEGRGALICYETDGTPIRMDIRFNRSFRLLVAGGDRVSRLEAMEGADTGFQVNRSTGGGPSPLPCYDRSTEAQHHAIVAGLDAGREIGLQPRPVHVYPHMSQYRTTRS
jgi:hypothetical protein